MVYVLLLLLSGAMFACTPFLFEILAATMIFTLRFARRPGFSKRVLWSGTIAFGSSLAVFWLCYTGGSWFAKNLLCYPLLFMISLIVPFACYDEPPIPLVFNSVCGYLLQHIASQISQMVWYGDMVTEIAHDLTLMLLFSLSRVLIYGLTYWLCYVLFVKNSTRTQFTADADRDMLGLAVITLLVVSVLSSIRDAYAQESYALMLISRMFSIFCCVFLLYLRWGLLEHQAIVREQVELLRLNALQRSQYEQRKENIELINIKCHDMKHRMAQWARQGGQVDPKEIQQMRSMIGIYDSAIQTGNETLDILLTERSLYCEQQGIRLSCMVDGSCLRFMNVGDICALFGNALENAIEAVSKLENPEDRIISFQVRRSKGMLVITVDNYFTGDLVFSEDLPRTTKDDHDFHGYGLKSIRMVAENYGGEVTLTVDEMFHLTVLLPLPEEQ